MNSQTTGARSRRSRSVLLSVLVLNVISAASAETTIDQAAKHVYSGNTGWVTLRYESSLGGSPAEGVTVHGSFLSGKAYAANFGWINLGDGSPHNGYAYSNRSVADWGVNHDLNGNLSGLAFGANVGWINFDWTSPNDSNRPHIDHLSGELRGFAYGANIGWIALAPDRARTTAIVRADRDRDNIPDAWEQQQFGNLSTASVGTDTDRDGETDSAEHAAGTDPNDPASFLKLQVSRSDQQSVISLTISPSYAGRSYRIHWSTDLVNWIPDSSQGPFIGDSSGITTKSLPIPGTSMRFWRVTSQPLLGSD